MTTARQPGTFCRCFGPLLLGLAWLVMVPTAAAWEDADLERVAASHPEWLAELAIETREVTLDGQALVLTHVRGAQQRPVFAFVMHDEEDRAFEAMIYLLATYGGEGIAVENAEQRRVDGVDLNRHFGRADRPELNHYFAARVRAVRAVIALHSNADGCRGDCVSLGDGMSLRNPDYFTYTCRGGDDEDNIVIYGEVGWSGRYADQHAFCSSPLAQHLTASGHNVGVTFFQDRSTGALDCAQRCNFQKFVQSYLGADYFNLEVAHGETSRQLRQVDAVMAWLESVGR